MIAEQFSQFALKTQILKDTNPAVNHTDVVAFYMVAKRLGASVESLKLNVHEAAWMHESIERKLHPNWI
jgi:hypothetical protein